MPDADLNPNQLKAVNHLDGPLMVIAGAGSGKTRVLTQRYLSLLKEREISAQNILCVTFTNKAAREMKKRIAEAGILLTRDNNWITTFHSLGARILKENRSLIFPNSPLNIINQNDSQKIISDIIAENSIATSVKPKTLASLISRAKDDCLNPYNFGLKAQGHKDQEDGYVWMEAAEIYAPYQEYLTQRGYVDFGDLLFRATRLFEDEPDILARYQNQLKYIQVDEYQDTNLAQHILLMQLAAKNKNVCVVGDPDQTIYTWRGARMENLKNFEKELGNAEVVILDENYRSNQNILNFANSLISFNTNRQEKHLWSSLGDGNRVFVKKCWNESKYISQKIIEMVEEVEEHQYEDICVLYRTNQQSAEIEQELRKLQIPYKLRGISFFDTTEIRNAIAFLKILNNPNDDVQLKRVLNVPRRGIGTDSQKRLQLWANQNSTSFYSALEQAESIQGVSKQAQKGIKKFLSVYEGIWNKWGKEKLNSPEVFSPALDELMENLGYYEYLEAEDAKEQLLRVNSGLSSRANNVKELIQLTLESTSLEDFLEMAVLDADAETENSASNANRVSLMTVHAAKGLEFSVVFVKGMSQGEFPLVGDTIDYEEERRLAYVAFTRAKERLIITVGDGIGRMGQKDFSSFIINGFGKFADNPDGATYAELEID